MYSSSTNVLNASSLTGLTLLSVNQSLSSPLPPLLLSARVMFDFHRVIVTNIDLYFFKMQNHSQAPYLLPADPIPRL